MFFKYSLLVDFDWLKFHSSCQTQCLKESESKLEKIMKNVNIHGELNAVGESKIKDIHIKVH